MGAQMNFFKNRIESFINAFRGLRDILKTEHNAWVHMFFTLMVLFLSWWLQVSFIEIVFIIIVTSLVWITEAFNTVLEIVIDIVSPQFSEPARRAKDIAAAAVLFSSVTALVTGLFILGPLLAARLGF